MSVHIAPTRMYLAIFGALMVLTVLTVWAAYQDFGVFADAVAMLIALTKATLVILFFMHVRYSTRLTAMVVVSSFFFLALMFTFLLSDYLSRGALGVLGK